MPHIELPALPDIEAALLKTTRRLTAELVAAQQEPPNWSDFEWRVATAAAAIHGISALLSRHLRWRGPDLWHAFLAEQLGQSLLRQRRIEAVLSQIDRAAIDDGIAVLGLKGAALLPLNLHGAGERPMADIDLLVKPEDLQATARLLEPLGYGRDHSSWRHQVFVPSFSRRAAAFGEHAENAIKVELHTQIMERLPVSLTEIRPFPTQARPGLNAYPSPAALMRHLLLHMAGNILGRSARLIQLRDIALLSQRLREEDWAELLDEGSAPLWWMFPPLALTARYHPQAITPQVLARMSRQCPWLLRRATNRQALEDLSLSHIKIQAFPGIEWSRTPAEALRLIASRVFPDKETLYLRRHQALSHPSLDGMSWARMSQVKRVMRWLISTPARVQTLHSVRLAMEYQPS